MKIVSVILAAVLVALLVGTAAAGGPAWTHKGAQVIATTLPDTLILSADAFFAGDGTNLVKKTVKGVEMKARKPFRFRAHTADGIEDALHALVDSTQVSLLAGHGGAPVLPCVEVFYGRVDTLFLTPATADTVYVRPLY